MVQAASEMKRLNFATSTIALLLLSFSVAYADDTTEINRHMARGNAAMQIAKSPTDYLRAVEEFSAAVKLAPDFDAAWFNMGMAQELAEEYQASIQSFRVYLEKSPQASDRDAVEARIYGLEYKMEMAPQVRVPENGISSLNGVWLYKRIFPPRRLECFLW